MYHQARPNRFPQRSHSNFQNRGGFRGHQPKYVDPALFVRPATYQQEETYVPQHSFSDFSIRQEIKQNIAARGYTSPTPIQDQAIPQILSGRDVVGIANTGTGKTAAFIVPILQAIMNDPSRKALIVAPTRELAMQIDEEFRAFAKGLRIYSTVCIGGVGMGGQIYNLRRNPHVVIGTPGRLIDLEKQQQFSFSWFETIVLDEVDRMLDMGFIHDVKYMISRLPKIRHSLFFSATLPENVKEVMQSFLHNPVTITIKKQEASGNVEQNIIRVNGKPKVDILHELLKQEGFDKVLVFGRTKHGLEKLSRSLFKLGVRTAAIHGNKSQSQRQRAIADFKQNKVKVLLATDIASRGLDIDEITHVINFDPPESYEDYIHRIGRTGRANKTGVALTFV